MIEGRDTRALIDGLGQLRSHLGALPDASLESLARSWYEKNRLAPALPSRLHWSARSAGIGRAD